MTLREFNNANPKTARQVLLECCGSGRWADAILARRAFNHIDELLKTAEACWWSLDADDWLEAFSKHPRIGERNGISMWSAEEQRGMAGAVDTVAARLAEKNIEYHQKFGWIFLICATGKSAEEMLSSLETRLQCDSDSELCTAAAEQAQITRLRLKKVLGE